MSNKGVFLFVVLSVISLFSEICGLKENDTCIVEGNPGVCTVLLNCPYADDLVRIQKKHPTHCAYREDHLEIVCCPTIAYSVGQFRDNFVSTSDGILRSRHMTCRSTGQLPLYCCDVKRDAPPPPEPAGCPAIIRPTKTIKHIAWDKCLEYQRYFSVCVRMGDDSQYERNETCVSSLLGDRITGGIPAEPAEFPHMALLGYYDQSEGRNKWGAAGTLISDRYILTAAHVLTHRQYGSVRYALLAVNNKSAIREGFLHSIVNRIPNKYYVSSEKYHDIALVELDSRVQFNRFARPACLPLPDMKLSKELVIAGWGSTGKNTYSDILLKTTVTKYPDCTDRVDPQSMPKGWDSNTMICAGDPGQTNDSCQGDSGGPLMAYVQDFKCDMYAVIGVVSFGTGCGSGGGAYTNVLPYLDWIVDKVWPAEK